MLQAADVQPFPERGWCCSYLLGIMNGSTVALNLNVMFEEHIQFHLSCAFSLLLSFPISSADSQSPWWAHVNDRASSTTPAPGFSQCVCEFSLLYLELGF